jgi:hypothetical protein
VAALLASRPRRHGHRANAPAPGSLWLWCCEWNWRAHPYHESCAHRCADQRLCRSPATVDRQVMCSSLPALLGAAGLKCRPRSEHLRASNQRPTAMPTSVSAGGSRPSGAKLPKERPGLWTHRRAFGQVRHGTNIQLLSFSLVGGVTRRAASWGVGAPTTALPLPWIRRLMPGGPLASLQREAPASSQAWNSRIDTLPRDGREATRALAASWRRRSSRR